MLVAKLHVCCVEAMAAQKADLREAIFGRVAAFTFNAVVHGDLALAVDVEGHVIGAAIAFLAASTHQNFRGLVSKR